MFSSCSKLKLTAPRPKYIERFGEAFVNEMNAFAECCLDDKREFDRAHRAQYLLVHSLQSGFNTGQC
jgi:hypothetical protein